MNRICFVSKKEEAQRLGLNARNVREWLTPQAKFFKQQFRAFSKAYHNFFETNMHLFCWNRLLFTGYSVLITNLDLLKLCGDGNPEMLQFLNIWVRCALKLFYVYQTKSLLLYSIEQFFQLECKLYYESSCSCNFREFSQGLVRLTKMIRGIGDPLVAIYARTYICRVSVVSYTFI